MLKVHVRNERPVLSRESYVFDTMRVVRVVPRALTPQARCFKRDDARCDDLLAQEPPVVETVAEVVLSTIGSYRKKGLHTLLDALGLVARLSPETSLRLAGSTGDPARGRRLQPTIRYLHLDRRAALTRQFGTRELCCGPSRARDLVGGSRNDDSPFNTTPRVRPGADRFGLPRQSSRAQVGGQPRHDSTLVGGRQPRGARA